MVKTARHIARFHARIANIRAHAVHHLTTDLVVLAIAQSGATREDGGGREPLVSQQQNVFVVWIQSAENAPLYAGVDVPRMSHAS